MNILLAGDGGQGIQTMAYVISQVIFDDKKFNISLIPNYGLEQRGGVSMVFLKIDKKEINYPKFSKADLLCTLSKQARERTEEYKDKNTIIIDAQDFEKELLENKINKISLNMFFLGILVSKFEKLSFLKSDKVLKKLEIKLKNKNNWEENKKTFKLGLKK